MSLEAKSRDLRVGVVCDMPYTRNRENSFEGQVFST